MTHGPTSTRIPSPRFRSSWAGDLLLREELRATLEGIRALPGRLQHPLLLRELAGLSTSRSPTSSASPSRLAEARGDSTLRRAVWIRVGDHEAVP
jgi:hypothetical protein